MSDDPVWSRQEVDSPCIRVCVVHREAGICTGCLRRVDEIARWSRMTAAERQDIVAALPGRRAWLRGQRRGGRAGRLQRG